MKFGNITIGGMSLGSVKIGGAKLGNTLVFSAGESPTPTPLNLLYEGQGITSNTDTEVKLFDPPIDWTILCDASCNNYGWNTTSHYEGIFGLSPNSQTFRLGKVNSAYNMTEDEAGDSSNYYYALSMYKSGETAKCVSLYSRNNGSLRRKVAIRYNSTTKKLEAIAHGSTGFTKWYTADVPTTSSNVILLVGGITATIHDIKIYQGLMDDASMFAYVE